MSIAIKSGAKVLYQWERGVALTASTPCDILRVSREDDRVTDDLYPVISGSTGTALIPDRMLTESGYLHVSRIDLADGSERVVETTRILVRHAAKPQNTASSTKEIGDMQALRMQMAALERAAREGKFDGKDGITPHIGENGNWFVRDVDLGIHAKGDKGDPGDTPYVGANGNWFVGDTDTGVPTSQGNEQIMYLYTNGVIVGEDENALKTIECEPPTSTKLAHQTKAGAVLINGIIKWFDAFIVTHDTSTDEQEYAVGFRYHKATREIEQKVWRIRHYSYNDEERYESLDEDGALLPVREGGIYDILIAYIQIPAGATGTGFWVDDLRGDETVCGFVRSKVHDFLTVQKQAKIASEAVGDIFGNGVLGTESFIPAAQEGTMKVVTSPGVAYIKGVRRKLAKSNRTYAVPQENRITAQILRLNEATGEIGYAIWKEVAISGDLDNGGTITDLDTGETLPLRSGGYYDLILSIVDLPAGTTEVTQDMIRDLRGDERYCGYIKDKLAPTKVSELENDEEFVNKEELERVEKVNKKIVWYGTDSSGPGTAVKNITTTTGDFALERGSILFFKLSNNITVQQGYIGLDIDGTGMKILYNSGVPVKFGEWKAGDILGVVYDGSRFERIDARKATTETYGVVKLSSATNSTDTFDAATPYAVKQAYDLASKANTESVKHAEQSLSEAQKAQARENIGAASSEEVTELSEAIDDKQYFSAKVDSAIKARHVDFSIKSKNLLDESQIVPGYFVWHTNGNLSANSSFAVSDYVDISGNTGTLAIVKYAEETSEAPNGTFHRCAFYDENKVYISGVSNGASTSSDMTTGIVKVPENAKYIRVSWNAAVVYRLIAYGDSTNIPYVPYETKDANPERLYDDLKKLKTVITKWNGLTWVSYGDSITAQGNNGGGYQNIVDNMLGFGTSYRRGVGGQTYKANTSTFYANPDGSYAGRYGMGGLTEAPEGTTEHLGYFASWDRITTMIHESIRESIDLVVLCGGTNDHGSVEDVETDGVISAGTPIWIAGSAIDAEWAASSYYADGDYDISTFAGAIASTVTKMRIWCPNAVVVLATPYPRWNTETKEQYANSKGLDFREMCEIQIAVAKYTACPVVDANAMCGVGGVNFADTVSDGVHPNTVGMKMYGKALADGLKDISPTIVV